jgi:hypothetical protein
LKTHADTIGQSRNGWPIDAISLLVLEAVSLIALQHTSAPVMAATQGVRYMPIGLYFQFLSDLPWSQLDLLLFGVALLTFVSIICLELARSSITRLFDQVFSRDLYALLFTAASCIGVCRYYFAPGRLSWGADASHHAVYTWIASEALQSGVLPVWTPFLSVGTYFVQYYGFLFAYLSGMASVIVGDLDNGIKYSLGVFHVVSGITAYLYVSKLTRSRSAGYISALAYVSIFWHTQLILILGRYSASLVFALLPLPFYALEGLRQEGSRRYVIIGAISIALLSFSHPGYAFWCVGFLLLFSFAHLMLQELPVRETLLMIGLGLALSAFLIIPMVYEQLWTGLGFGFSMANQAKPTLGHILSWSCYRARLTGIPDGGHWFGAYLGVSLLLLVLAGCLARIPRPRLDLPRDLPLAGLVISLLITFGYSLFPFKAVESMGAARYLVFASFFLSCLAGISLTRLATRWPQFTRLTFLTITLVLIDLGSTTFLQPFHFVRKPHTAANISEDLYTSLSDQGRVSPDGVYSPSRSLHSIKQINSFLSVSTETPTAFGLFEEHPRADRGFVRPFLEKLRDSVRGDRSEIEAFLNSATGTVALNGLRLLNTRNYIGAKGDVPTAHLDLDPVSPIVISSRKTPSPRDNVLLTPDETFELIRQMDLDPEYDRCQTILVSEGEREELPTEPEIELTSHVVKIDQATITFRTTADAFARLSYGYYPNLNVMLDGVRADYFPTADGFIGLRIPAGDHSIQISGSWSTLRTIIFWIDVILLAGALYWSRQRRITEKDQEVQ